MPCHQLLINNPSVFAFSFPKHLSSFSSLLTAGVISLGFMRVILDSIHGPQQKKKSTLKSKCKAAPQRPVPALRGQYSEMAMMSCAIVFAMRVMALKLSSERLRVDRPMILVTVLVMLVS